MSKDNQGAIFIASFSEQLIREKVMMDEPDRKKYLKVVNYLKAKMNYEQHVASRRTFPYPVKKEQDGKEIPESEFQLRNQWYDDKNNIWVDYFKVESQYMIGKNYKLREIAIPIEPETKIKNMKSGIELIAEERQEQIVKHGFDAKHDAEVEKNGGLSTAAMCLLAKYNEYEGIDDFFPLHWGQSWKDKFDKYDDLKCLIIAGALIAAEIDRLQNQPT